MYVVQHFAEESVPVMRAYLAENPFAALVVQVGSEISVDHIPLEFEPAVGPNGCLLGHIARSNPLWREFESGPAMAVFSGHHAYVSPDWYASKEADPRVVPTWNYAAVHVSGTLRFFHESDRIHALLERLTSRFESARPSPWRMSDAPPEFISQLAGAVVGVQLDIDHMVGKWKLSQNRPSEDRNGVMAGLRREGSPGDVALADLMEAKERVG